MINKYKRNDRERRSSFRKLLRLKLIAWKNGDISDSPTHTEDYKNPSSSIDDEWESELCHILFLDDAITDNSDTIDFPPSLLNWQRKEIHLAAAELELDHGSFGQGTSRFVRVSKVSFVADDPDSWSELQKPDVEYQYFNLSEEDKMRAISQLEQFGRVLASSSASLWNYHLHRDLLVAQSGEFGEDLSSCIGVGDGGGKCCCVYIDNPRALHAMARVLTECRVFSFDMEMHSQRSYLGLTCLIQIACHNVRHDTYRNLFGPEVTGEVCTADKSLDFDFLVDTLALPWKTVRTELAPLFADPVIVKVCHGAQGGDIPALYRDFGIALVNSFDTQEAVRLMGYSKPGLANVLQDLKAPGSVDFKKTKEALSTADWRQR